MSSPPPPPAPSAPVAPSRRSVEAAIEDSRRLAFQSPARALAAVEAAVEACADLGRQLSAVEAADLAAWAWAARGNAHRAAADLVAAEADFRTADGYRRRGSGDPLLAARLDDLFCSLLGDQRRHTEALERNARSLVLYRGRDEPLLLARALVLRGHLLNYAGEPEAAVLCFKEAAPLLSPERDLPTFLACVQNLALSLNRLGYTTAAVSLLADLRTLHRRRGDEVSLLRLLWLEAEIYLELGDLERGQRVLTGVRNRFFELGMLYDGALASLDLAEVYLRERRTFRLRKLAEEMFPVFQSQRIHREAVAALILFREAVATGEATEKLIRHVADFLRRVQRDRALRFRPPGRR